MLEWIIPAFILDLVLGDPYSWPHPVKWMGNYISFFQKKNIHEGQSEKAKFWLGVLLWFTTVGTSGIITALVLKAAFQLHEVLGIVIYIYLGYTTLAAKSLAVEGGKVYEKLVNAPLQEARKQVAMIVGRDTSELSEKEIMNATIETIAENSSDGVIAPLFYLFLGGPVLGMMYKAVNTLDSMVGYLTPKYKALGCFSARMDDIWNFIPARLTWLFLIIASGCSGLNIQNAIKIGWQDCRKHKSPNSGFPEAVAAGALGIQLGGTHVYHGVAIEKPTIGVNLKQVSSEDILLMNKLLYVAAAAGLIVFSIAAGVIRYFLGG